MSSIPIEWFLFISAIIFCIGLLVVLTRRHVVGVLMGLELMLNASNLNLAAFSNADTANHAGSVFGLFNLAVFAAEAAVAIVMVYLIVKNKGPVNIDEIR